MNLKLLFIALLLATVQGASAQVTIPGDIVFDKNVLEAENHWVARPPRTHETGLHFAFVYFDEHDSRYRLKTDGYFEIREHKLANIEDEFKPDDITEAHNLSTKVAILSEQRVGELGLEQTPVWLKEYQVYTEPGEKMLARAMAVHNMNEPETTLALLLQAYDMPFRSELFYDELLYTYIDLGKLQEAETVMAEAQKSGLSKTNFVAANLLLLSRQKQWDKADQLVLDFTKAHSGDELVNPILYNLVYIYFQAKNYEAARKWIAYSRDHMVNDIKYAPAFEKMERKMTQGSEKE